MEIACAKAPHTAGENLNKPASVEMARIMCGDAVANKLEMVPLSNDTMKRRIKELSRNVLQQTIAAIRHCERFNLQLDETTDIGSDAQLMVFVRYFDTNDFVEQFLFCRPLAKIPQEKKYSRKWISSLKNISSSGLIACLFVLMVLQP